MKLSQRLTQLEKMVTSNYTHIWDCCCDHGFLGASLLSKNPQSTVHFVDIVPKLMADLDAKLQQFHSDSNWETHCIDVAKLPLSEYKGNHLVIIAGVGGDLIIEFVEGINQQYPDLKIEFLLCPVYHQYALREKLIELEFSLKDEVLIADKQRFYEVIHVETNSDEINQISSVGDKIWQSDSHQQHVLTQEYLSKTLSHYRRIQQGKPVQHIIDAYSQIDI